MIRVWLIWKMVPYLRYIWVSQKNADAIANKIFLDFEFVALDICFFKKIEMVLMVNR